MGDGVNVVSSVDNDPTAPPAVPANAANAASCSRPVAERPMMPATAVRASRPNARTARRMVGDSALVDTAGHEPDDHPDEEDDRDEDPHGFGDRARYDDGVHEWPSGRTYSTLPMNWASPNPNTPPSAATSQ